jgi:hypothetical protein
MRGPIFCYCKIGRGKIVHCALHDNATYLVGVCEHIYALLRDLEIHDPAQKARIDQVVLPFGRSSRKEKNDGTRGRRGKNQNACHLSSTIRQQTTP